MQQVNIKDFVEGDSVEGFYAVKEASFQTTATGKNYIRLTISDASGAINGNMWDASKELFLTFSVGSIVKLRALVEVYRGKPQVKVEKLRVADENEVDYSLFIPKTRFDIEELWNEFMGFAGMIADTEYKAVIDYFFNNPEIMKKFKSAPAAKNNHHAYIGGLLEHTVSLLRYAVAFATASPTKINLDLLIAGTMLHDIGKIHELSVGVVIDYTDRGRLTGHLIIGSMMVEDAAREIGGISEEKKYLLEHLILSHHGKFEYGSPVLPAVPEALALHHIDNLDAKTVAACRIIEDDESNGSWTDRSWMLDTMLYKQGQGCSVSDSSVVGEASAVVEDKEPVAVDSEVPEVEKPTSGSLF